MWSSPSVRGHPVSYHRFTNASICSILSLVNIMIRRHSRSTIHRRTHFMFEIAWLSLSLCLSVCVCVCVFTFVCLCVCLQSRLLATALNRAAAPPVSTAQEKRKKKKARMETVQDRKQTAETTRARDASPASTTFTTCDAKIRPDDLHVPA